MSDDAKLVFLTVKLRIFDSYKSHLSTNTSKWNATTPHNVVWFFFHGMWHCPMVNAYYKYNLESHFRENHKSNSSDFIFLSISKPPVVFISITKRRLIIMVNKCSVAGCKSLYVKDNVKLHRFPLTNAETLPLWITATGREKEWKPCKSSRLCGNHFKESEYIIGHGKGVLKSTAIPTIEYRVNIPRYTKRKYPYSNLYEETHKNKRKANEPMENDLNIKIVPIDYNEINNIKKDHQNKIRNNEEITNDNGNNDDEEELRHDGIMENSKNDILNRENQCYMFTSSFIEDMEPIVLKSPDLSLQDKPYDESFCMIIDQTSATSNFEKIMELKFKSTNDIYSLYFQSLIKKNLSKQENTANSLDDDMLTFGAFIVTEMNELRPYRKLYLTTKHQIKKLLVKARLKIAN